MDINRIARNIISRIMEYDRENLFPVDTPMEDMENAAVGVYDIIPQLVLRGRNYGKIPLVGENGLLRFTRDYGGDKVASSSENLLDFSMPSEMLKHQEEPYPRDLTDTFYELNRPGDGAGMDTLQDYNNRDWEDYDSPEISEDKILRMRWKFPFKPVEPYRASSQEVVARHLLRIAPLNLELSGDDIYSLGLDKDGSSIRTAKLLSELEKSLIYTKKHGWRVPGSESVQKVSVLLKKAEPKVGRWTFRTSSGKDQYITIFQFIPYRTTKEVSKLHVRVSCSCPSWLYWGAQYNAFMGDYLYGSIRPKFTSPNVRDPGGKFLVCKHVLACLSLVRHYRLGVGITEDVRKRILKDPKVKVDLSGFDEPVRIPKNLLGFAELPEIREAVKSWKSLNDSARREFVFSLDNPQAVAVLAHLLPDTATVFVAEKLKDMAINAKNFNDRRQAKYLLRGVLGG